MLKEKFVYVYNLELIKIGFAVFAVGLFLLMYYKSAGAAFLSQTEDALHPIPLHLLPR
jgi:hypothetical protein